MPVTTKDIARICGVSRGTVDRALNGRTNISLKTKEKILQTAQELGYRPNIIARSLVKGQTMSIGVVVFDLYNRFFAQLLNALELKAREKGYFTFVTITEKDPVVEKDCLSHLADRNVDGIIIFSVNKGKEYEEFLKLINKPIVTIGNIISRNWPFVGINDRQGIKDAVECIIEKDYENIIYVCPSLGKSNYLNMYALEERLSGYLDLCRSKGIDCQVVQDGDYCNTLLRILPNESRRTAILCSSDIYALEIMMCLTHHHYQIPKDFGLMGFDNIDILKYAATPLSTVAYPIEAIAEYSINTLIRSIHGEEVPICMYLDHSVVMRDSL